MPDKALGDLKNRPPVGRGWTIMETIHNALDPEIRGRLEAARRACERVPRRRKVTVISLVNLDPSVAKHSIRDYRRRAPKAPSPHDAYLVARNVTVKELRRPLVAGEKIAFGRYGSRLAELRWIPGSAWKFLRFSSLKNSIVKEGRVSIYDVQIYPAEFAPQVSPELFHVNSTGSVEKRLNTSELQRAPAQPRKSSKRIETKVDAYQECLLWLTTEMKVSPHERRRTKEKWWEGARKRWPDKLSHRAFFRAWDQAVKDAEAYAWAAAGAPKKKSPR